MSRRRRIALIGVVVAAFLAASVAAIAVSTSTVTNGVNNIRVKTETGTFTTASTSWVDVPKAKATFKVPEGSVKTFLAEFSAESLCDGDDAGWWCSLRITVNDVEMEPASGTNFAFDTDGPGAPWGSHAMTRVAVKLPAGTYVFQVEARVSSTAVTNFTLDDWTFVVTKAATKP